MRLLLSAEISARQPWGSFPPTATIPRLPRLLPAATRLCAHRSSHLQIKQGSPPPRAPQLALPSRSPFQEAFFSCRRKASLAGFLLTNPGVRESNPGVHLAPCSLPLPGSSQPIRTKPVIFCHMRGGDSSMWWTSLTHKRPREEGEWCQIKTQFKRQRSSTFPHCTAQTWLQGSSYHT